MSGYPGYVPIGGPFSPTDTSDTYPVTDTQFSLGGPWQVTDSTVRDAIPTQRRRAGSIATTLSDYHQWQLQGGITNADWVDITSGGGPTTITVELGATFATNQPYQIVSGIAQPVTSTSASFPFVDGITLESGASTQIVPVANGETAIYPTLLALPGSDGAMLYLSQTGVLTATVPSSAAGDVWAAPLVRRVTSTTFVYAPQTPIKLA
jgi:hypothetical protein